jgi:NADH ubiquinone oxidoreductase, 20 Kd subunit
MARLHHAGAYARGATRARPTAGGTIPATPLVAGRSAHPGTSHRPCGAEATIGTLRQSDDARTRAPSESCACPRSRRAVFGRGRAGRADSDGVEESTMGVAGGLRMSPIPEPAATPPPGPDPQQSWLLSALTDRGISRRRFLGFASAMTALLALPQAMTPQIAKALESTRKPVVVWLEFQDCAGNSESMLRSSHPTVADVVLDVLSWEYHETIMAGAGHQAEAVLERVRTGTDPYVLIVEGSIPTAENGIYCTIGGKTAIQILQEMASKAALVVAVGACAWDGGFPRLGPTGAVGVGDIIGNKPLVNLGGCPPRPWTSTTAPCSPTATSSTTSASAGPTSMPAASSTRGVTRATATAGASTRWAARAPRRPTTARSCAGTTAPTGPSGPGTAASPAHRPGSGSG